MNEELQGTLNDALISIIESAASAKDFILAETPEVIEQLLMWHFAMSLVGFVVFLSIFTAAIFFMVLGFRRGWDGEGIVSLFFVSAVSLIVTVSSHAWLQILIAPKLYLLEYAADLVK